MEIECDFCGKTFEYTEPPSHYKRSKHHYCSRTCQAKGVNLQRGNNLHGMANDRKPRYVIWQSAKKRARKKDMEFTIKPQDIPEIPDKCPVLGIDIKPNKEVGPKDSSPSLDRIDSSQGYIPNNIRIISNRANRLRQDANIEEIRLILEDMISYE